MGISDEFEVATIATTDKPKISMTGATIYSTCSQKYTDGNEVTCCQPPLSLNISLLKTIRILARKCPI